MDATMMKTKADEILAKLSPEDQKIVAEVDKHCKAEKELIAQLSDNGKKYYSMKEKIDDMSEQDPSTSIEIKVGMEDKPMDKPMNPMQ
jgi:sporulation-control protein spo0M